MSDLVVVGHDAANSYVKSVSEDKSIVYPNTLRERPEQEEAFLNGTRQPRFTYKGVTYTIGEARFSVSSSARDSDRYLSDVWRTESIISVAQHVKNRNRVKVVTGVPSNHYGNSVAKDIENALVGSHTVVVDGKKRTFEIAQTTVVLQPMGTLFYLIVHDDGTLRKETAHLLDNLKIIIDIGFGSTDIAIVDGSELIEYFGVDASMLDAYERILQKSNLANELTPLQAEQQLRQGTSLSYGGQHFDVTDLKKESFKLVAQSIISKVKNRKSLESFDASIFTGGGVQALHSDLKRYLVDVPNAVPVSNSQEANAYGYYLYGLYGRD